ncbi:MAG: SMC-Scp complex subunit ScpB [Planctomycetia bacterium]|nr:SMC-Scp complex subunit ScpB [Planctomycetia bacterium]
MTDEAPEPTLWQVDAAEEPAAPEPEPEVASPAPTIAPAAAAPAVPPPPKRIVEALLFVGGAPLTAERAAEAVRGLTPEQLQEAIADLNRDYREQGRPYAIVPKEHGWVLTLRPRYRPVIDRLYGSNREARLSQQVIDVLALVAYRQPATRQEIDTFRGAESGSLLRQLVRRGLIAVVQRGDASQREVAYGTTQRFLDLFNLRSLEDLPQTQDLQRL